MSGTPSSPKSSGSEHDSEIDEVLVDGQTLNSLLADRAAKRRRLARKAELARLSRAKKKNKIEELERQVATMQREIELEEEKARIAEQCAANNTIMESMSAIDRLLALHTSSRAEIEDKLQVCQTESRRSSNKELISAVDALTHSIRQELDSGISAFAQLRAVCTDEQIQSLLTFIENHGEILLSAR